MPTLEIANVGAAAASAVAAIASWRVSARAAHTTEVLQLRSDLDVRYGAACYALDNLWGQLEGLEQRPGAFATSNSWILQQQEAQFISPLASYISAASEHPLSKSALELGMAEDLVAVVDRLVSRVRDTTGGSGQAALAERVSAAGEAKYHLLDIQARLERSWRWSRMRPTWRARTQAWARAVRGYARRLTGHHSRS